jgi:exopolysaccharide biosynthesis polyprenyl glycosylphosphotransferase
VHRRDRGWRVRWAVLAAGDMLAAVLAYLVAFILRVVVPLPLTQGYLPAVRFAEVNHHWLELLLAQVATLYFLGLYETRAVLRPRPHVAALVAAAILQALILIAVYFFRQDLVFPRSIFVVFACLNAAFLAIWRLGCSALLGGYPRRRVLVVGTNAAAGEVIEAIRVQQWLGLDVVGIAASGRNGTRPSALEGVPVLGRREELPLLCDRHAIDEVIIASDPSWQDELLDAFSRAPRMRSRVSVVPSPFEILIGRRETLRLHDIPLIEVLEDVPGGAGSIIKRLFDAVLAGLLLIVTLPVMALVALAVRLSSRGPVIFRQTRVGRNGEPFTIFKFRTMHEEAEVETGPVLATPNDPRVTLLGRLLRATRLDELPQLWNVLRGDMSFVGPRPERPEFVDGYQRDIHGYTERFKVRPGLTGYAQVNGEYHTSASTKLKYDLAYIHNRSLWLDLRILSETMKVMLTRRGV